MSRKPVEISKSIDVLREHLDEIITITEWAEKMGYEKPGSFQRDFRSHYGVYPKKVIVAVRSTSIVLVLRQNSTPNLTIAKDHGITNDKLLNNFLNYHLECSPSEIKEMPKPKLADKLHKTFQEKLGEKFWDQYSGVILGNDFGE